MNTSNVILIGRYGRKKAWLHLRIRHIFGLNRHLGRALRTVRIVTVIAFLVRPVLGSIRR